MQMNPDNGKGDHMKNKMRLWRGCVSLSGERDH